MEIGQVEQGWLVPKAKARTFAAPQGGGCAEFSARRRGRAALRVLPGGELPPGDTLLIREGADLGGEVA